MVDKAKSKLADTHGVPQIVDAVDFVADAATTGVYADDDDALVSTINSIRDALVTHGLMKAS